MYICKIKNPYEAKIVIKRFGDIWVSDGTKEGDINFLTSHYIPKMDFPVNLIYNNTENTLQFESYGVNYGILEHIDIDEISNKQIEYKQEHIR